MNDVMIWLRKDEAVSAAAVVFAVGLATIGGFLFFEYVLGYPPCPLCLDQRMAFYVSVPLAALLWLGAGHGAARKVLLLGFLVIAALMLWNTGLAVFHAGVEWKWWPGPTACTGAHTHVSLEELKAFAQGRHVSIVRCDQPAFRFLGLSMAGWNTLIALKLTVLSVVSARRPL